MIYTMKLNSKLSNEIHLEQEKRDVLKALENISFEEISEAILNGNLLDIEDNSGSQYSHQLLFFVLVVKDNYVYKVPCVELEKPFKVIHLITAFKDRKLTKSTTNKELYYD